MLCKVRTLRINMFLVVTGAVLAISVTTLPTLAGDGRNGPQISGEAIPVTVDRALTVAQLVTVTQTCAEGLLKRLISQIYKVENPFVFVYGNGRLKPDLSNFRAFLEVK